LETDFKTPREKENIYKEFERYDEKYSHLKPETNCKEAKETKNRRNIFKQEMKRNNICMFGEGEKTKKEESTSRNTEKRDVTEKGNSTTEKSTIKVGGAHSHQNSSKIGDNLNLKTPASEISTLELSQNQNLNLLKKIKQNENKTNKMNKQKRKEKKKDQKSAQFLKKLNVSSIEATCAKSFIRN